METFFKDLKHSLRMFAHNPGFTLAAVAVLALGIGANSAIFSVINTVLLKPLAFPDPDRMVQFMLASPQGNSSAASVPYFVAWREQSGVFQDVAACDFDTVGMNLTGGGVPEQVHGTHVTADYFRLFGARVLLGRTFSDEEDRPNSGRVVVLSEGLWRRRFGSNPRIVGSTISLAGEPYTVVGVVQRIALADPAPELWVPFQFDLGTTNMAHYFAAFGRLKPGVTVEQANAQLRGAYTRYLEKYGQADPHSTFAVQTLQESLVGDVRASLMVLAVAVAFVLLIACANVASLLLVRATGRKREIAIRAAVGASRVRIMRQLLTESVVLSLAGGAIGLAFGTLGVRALLAINPGNVPRIGEHGAAVALDGRVLLFTIALSLVTGILFGLIPALSASHADLSATLKESGGRSGTSFRQNKTRSVLVVVEMALALMLLVGAGLLIRTFIALRSVDAGFDPHNVLLLRMSLQSPRFAKTAAVAQLVHDATERMDAVPGVAASASTCSVPLAGGFGLPFIIAGRPLNGSAHGSVGWTSISPDYFDVFRIPLTRGRKFTEQDNGGAAPVVVISQAMARKYWPSADPIGQQIIIGKGIGPEFVDQPRQIVGVVGDIRSGSLDRDPGPAVYIPVAQVPEGMTALNQRIGPIAWIVRTRVAPRTLAKAIENELRQASGGLPLAEITTMDEVVADSTARANFNMSLLTIFAAAALLLAAIGIYGLMAYTVQQRTQEIGIRMALGAGRGRVRNMVVAQGMRLALTGVVLGLGAAFGLARLLTSFLFGVKTWDPVAFVVVPLMLSAVALIAVWVPARRATRVDPLNALRYE